MKTKKPSTPEGLWYGLVNVLTLGLLYTLKITIKKAIYESLKEGEGGTEGKGTGYATGRV